MWRARMFRRRSTCAKAARSGEVGLARVRPGVFFLFFGPNSGVWGKKTKRTEEAEGARSAP